MSKRPIAALKEVYEDDQKFTDLEFLTVLFDNKASAEEFGAQMAPLAIEQTTSLHRLGKNHWLVSLKTYEEGCKSAQDDIDRRLSDLGIPVIQTGYGYEWGEQELTPVMNLTYNDKEHEAQSLAVIADSFHDHLQSLRR